MFLNKKKSVSKDDILSSVWNYASDADTHTVETHIYRLRKKVIDKFKENVGPLAGIHAAISHVNKISKKKAVVVTVPVDTPFIPLDLICQLKKNCITHAASIGIEIKFDQSNIEGEIVIMIQKAKGVFDGIIINAAGYTHTSVAILDALLAIKLPVIEVHITNIYNREEFRKKSLISRAAKGIICGFGVNGYIMALDSMKKIFIK